MPAAAAVAEQVGAAAVAPLPGTSVVDALCGGTTLPARTAVAVEPPTVAAGTPGRTATADPTGPALAEQPATVATGTPGRAKPPGPTCSAGADQPRASTGTADLAGRSGAAVAPIAVQDPAVASTLSSPRHPIVAVADQRAPQQRLGGRIDHVEHCLQRRGVGDLRACILPRSRVKGGYQLVVKRRHLGAERLIGLGMSGKHCGDRRRHLIGTRGQRAHGRRCGGDVSLTDRRADAC